MSIIIFSVDVGKLDPTNKAPVFLNAHLKKH